MNELGVFAKYWEPGAVKTRLAAAIGDNAASEVYRSCLQTVMGRLSLARLSAVVDRRVVCYSPKERSNEFAALAGAQWIAVPQSEGDLGARMQDYFESALALGADRVVLMGSDSPTVPIDYVEKAFQQLKNYPVVMGPSADGGYYLIGISGNVPPIFQSVQWSTSSVWEQTLALLEEANCPFGRLQPWYDVDEISTLIRLRDELAALIQGDSTWNDLLEISRTALARHGATEPT